MLDPGIKLSKPPIAEALIDFRVQPRDDLAPTDFEALREAFGTEAFPSVSTQQINQIQIQFGPDGGHSTSEAMGLLFRSADQTQVIQAQRNGFAFSQLVPYTSWEQLTGAAREHWYRYLAAARPRQVTRLAARYINRIEVPGPMVRFQDWFPYFPDLPENLPQSVTQSMCRSVIPIPNTGVQVIVTQALDPSVSFGRLGMVTVVLDIDVFRAGVWMPHDEGIFDALAGLRAVKNDFFYGFISEKTLELFR